MKLFYREYGTGKPILFLHGMLGMSDNWITIGKVFADRYKVYLPDMRNHGLSPHHKKHNFQVMSDDLLEFLNDKKIDKAIIIGHSMGGKVAMQFAVNHPEKIDKLVIVDISPREYFFDKFEHKRLIDHKGILDFMDEIDISKIENRQGLNEVINNRFQNEFILQLLQKNLIKNSVKGYKWKLNIHSLIHNYSELSKEIRINQRKFTFKSLFLFGNKSPYFLQDDYTLIKDKIPNTKIVIIKNAGHLIHIDQKDELINEVKEFLLKQYN